MTINLRPELERLIQQDVERGPYKTVDEFVERAIQLLHEQEEWLAANQAEISAAIDDGYAAARRGELIDSDRVQTQLEQKKNSWRADRRRL